MKSNTQRIIIGVLATVGVAALVVVGYYLYDRCYNKGEAVLPLRETVLTADERHTPKTYVFPSDVLDPFHLYTRGVGGLRPVYVKKGVLHVLEKDKAIESGVVDQFSYFQQCICLGLSTHQRWSLSDKPSAFVIDRSNPAGNYSNVADKFVFDFVEPDASFKLKSATGKYVGFNGKNLLVPVDDVKEAVYFMAAPVREYIFGQTNDMIQCTFKNADDKVITIPELNKAPIEAVNIGYSTGIAPISGTAFGHLFHTQKNGTRIYVQHQPDGALRFVAGHPAAKQEIFLQGTSLSARLMLQIEGAMRTVAIDPKTNQPRLEPTSGAFVAHGITRHPDCPRVGKV